MVYFNIRVCVGLWSVCCRFEFGIVGMLSVTIPALCYWSVFNRCHVSYLSISNRAIPHRILPEMTPTRTRLLLRCFHQHRRWPTAGRFIENFAVFVGFVSVWPVWLGYKYKKNPSRPVDATEWTRFSKSRSNELEDIGQGQRSSHATHLLMLVIICTKYEKNPRTVDATERTQFSRPRPNDLEDIGQGHYMQHTFSY